jgi:pyrroline-5-carboxylate reductase
MGRAMLVRWLAAGLDPAQVTVIDPAVTDLPPDVRHLVAAPDEAVPDMLVLAIKPQQLADVAPTLTAWQGTPPVILSILAGVEAATLRDKLAAPVIIRAMPNLPVSIGKGVVALFSDSASDDQRAAAEQLARPLGLVEWIDEEALFHAVTALPGSGPGFVFRIIEALAAGGTRAGLPAEKALRFAIATVEGAAALAAASDELPRTLANRVASKGGTTQAGLDVLDADGALNRIIADTIAAAARRSRELAEAAR